MKKLFTFTCLLLLFVHFSPAQSKVFKEVSEGISSQMNLIIQDGALVGYLVFTQLERASADSFNYKIAIMDENLNDIGSINFREQKLFLQAVSFEQDVLCLAYVKSNVIGNEYKSKKEYRSAIPGARNYIFTQFLGLNGKILKTNAVKADIKLSEEPFYGDKKVYGDAKLKHGVQLKNIPQKGFACFYGDDARKNLLVFNTAGKQTWQKGITEDAEGYHLLTSGTDVYILMKKKEAMLEGGYELLGYNTADSSVFPKYVLKDKKGNSLRAIAFSNDPVTGKPFIAGTIINPDHGRQPLINVNQLSRTAYTGAFTVNFAGHKKGDIHEIFSYWDNGSNPQISRKGRWEVNKSFVRFEESFRDYKGNTYFAGSAFSRKPKWVAIGLAAATSPFVIPSLGIMGICGTKKVKMKEAMLVKQDPKGALTLESAIPVNNTGFYRAIYPIAAYDTRNYHQVDNAESKTNYLIVDDKKSIIIYNVTQKKIARTIPHKDGNIFTSIYPAKEGHVMVSEYNKKEKYTRFSIESL